MRKQTIHFAILLTAFFVFTKSAFAFESAVRSPNEDWTYYADPYQQIEINSGDGNLSARPTPLRMATTDHSQLQYQNLPEWTGEYWQLQLMFVKARDQRLYTDPKQPGFLRRTTWLYPVDGCYARAAHIARVFEADGKMRPGKVFAFGNLKMNTQFDRSFSVYWWYHVAAAFRYGPNVIVLDPSADPQKPLLLKDWLAKISHRPERVRVALCDTRAYMPSTLCVGGTERQESRSLNHQVWLLSKEWNRLVSLNMDPVNLLGENPPWKFRFPWSQ